MTRGYRLQPVRAGLDRDGVVSSRNLERRSGNIFNISTMKLSNSVTASLTLPQYLNTSICCSTSRARWAFPRPLASRRALRRSIRISSPSIRAAAPSPVTSPPIRPAQTPGRDGLMRRAIISSRTAGMTAIRQFPLARAGTNDLHPVAARRRRLPCAATDPHRDEPRRP